MSTNVALGQVREPSPSVRTIILQVIPSESLVGKLKAYGEVISRGNYIRLVLPLGISRLSVEATLNQWQDIIRVSEPKSYQGLYVPNDPLYGPSISQQWFLPRIHADAAWDLTKGQASIVVAVVDTGLDLNHPDLQGQWINGYNELNPQSLPQDNQGHGTHVSGIIAAALNNSIGVAGIAPQCKIMPIKALDSNGQGDDMDIAVGIRWAVDHGAKIINLSLGSPLNSNGTYDDSGVVDDAVKYAHSKGVLLVAAAGNDGIGILNYPAALPGVIAVGSADSQNRRSYFSNYGSTLSLLAPGEQILSTFPVSLPGQMPYQSLSGTSVATPIVSAVAALIWSANPTWNKDQVIQKLLSSANVLQTQGWTATQGFGQVDALQALLPTPVPEWPIPNALLNSVGQIKARFDSSSMIQPSSVQLYVDSTPISTNYSQGKAVGNSPSLGDGVHHLELHYRDIVGQDHSFAWSFTLVVQTMPGRLWGKDRIGTSMAISQQGWPYGASTVFLDGYDDWPDALASIPLAFQDNAPLLLTTNDTLDAQVQSEINRLHPSKIVILGGNGVITDSLKQNLQKLWPQVIVDRIGGSDRFQTAALLAQRLRSANGEAVLASGLDFADALSAAPFAARQGIPILLTNPDALPKVTQNVYNALHITKTYVIGGPASISDRLYKTLNAPTRYGGQDRFGTAAAVNTGLMGTASKGYFVTDGYEFPDSLSVAVLSARMGYPLLPVTPTSVPDATSMFIRSLPVPPQQKIAVGGPSVVSILP